MKNFDTRAYSISDFIEWNENNILELSPEFQRRPVWSEKAKSYLIDTIICGKPIPKIIIKQKLEGTKTVRVVVDGQQRLRAIIGFYDNDFKISKAHNEELAGMTYDSLPEEIKKDFLKYELGVNVLFDISYEDILDIFTRINAYTVSLNNQEKFNAKYLGFFKQFVFKFGNKYVRYFLDSEIIAKSKITRMGEAKLAADLFVSLIDGVQTNKGIERFYKKYEDEIGDLKSASKKFDNIMSYIGEIYSPEDLSKTNWARPHLFYTLFNSIGHLLFGIGGLDPNLKVKVKIDEKSIGKLRVILDEISSKYDEVSQNIDDDSHPSDYKAFIDQSRRGTTDTKARIGRSNFVCKKIIEKLS